MALRFIDSFDHYAPADASRKWTTASFHGRHPGQHGYGYAGVFSKGMLFPTNRIIMEAYVKRLSQGTIFGLQDTNPENQISCGYSSIGQVRVHQWAGPVLFESVPDLLRAGGWYHFSWDVLVHSSAGSVLVKLNGETLCNLTGIRTASGLGDHPAFWSGTVGAFSIGDNANGTVFDDLVVMDDVDDGINDARLPGGGGFDKMLGPVEIICKRPNGVGLLHEWTPAGEIENWQNVDDLDPDLDTSYNGALPDAVGDSDLFAMQDLAPDQDVVGAQTLVLARKTEEGIAAVAPLVHHAGTTTVGATVYQPSTYSYMHTPVATLPDGTLWTKEKWDALQVGYRRMV